MLYSNDFICHWQNVRKLHFYENRTEIYIFSKIGPKITFCSKMGSKFTFAFCSKIGHFVNGTWNHYKAKSKGLKKVDFESAQIVEVTLAQESSDIILTVHYIKNTSIQKANNFYRFNIIYLGLFHFLVATASSYCFVFAHLYHLFSFHCFQNWVQICVGEKTHLLSAF